MSDASAEHEDDNISNDSVTVSGDFQFQDSRAEEDFEQAKQPLVSVATRFVRWESKVLGLECLAVSPSHQGQGIGKRLLEQGKNLASEQGWRIVAVCAGDRNLRFYERLGLAWLAKTTLYGVDLYGIVG